MPARIARSDRPRPSPIDDGPETERETKADDRRGTAGQRGSDAASRGRRSPILAWDVGHNPLGRAYVLAGVLRRRFETEIWGAQFKRYGAKVWAPLRDCDIPIHVHDGRPFPAHLDVMEQVARRIDADAIYVSKPRLPSFGVGILGEDGRNRPLVLDVDDDELAFFGEHDGISATRLLKIRGDHDVTLPFGRLWTRACEPFIAAADAPTVSNHRAAERFGGMIVPHARDERRFDPARYDRSETRRRLGIVRVATAAPVRRHAARAQGHRRVAAGARSTRRRPVPRRCCSARASSTNYATQIGSLERWVTALPYQSFDELPRIVGAADLACVLQDPEASGIAVPDAGEDHGRDRDGACRVS